MGCYWSEYDTATNSQSDPILYPKFTSSVQNFSLLKCNHFVLYLTIEILLELLYIIYFCDQ